MIWVLVLALCFIALESVPRKVEGTPNTVRLLVLTRCVVSVAAIAAVAVIAITKLT